jgi:hypothetical protein
MTTQIQIGCPVQANRDWILPYYLHNLTQLTYPKKKLHPTFFYNKPKDEPETAALRILKEWIKEYKDKYADISLWEAETNYQDGRVHGRFFSFFADIRNHWLTMRNEEDTHTFSVDSDILIPPHTLKQLLQWDKDIVSALIYNGPIPETGAPAYNFMAKTNFKHSNGDKIYVHMSPGVLEANSEWTYQPQDNTYKLTELPEVPMTGACFLIRKEVLDAGVQFGYHVQGEDIIFCEQATQHGYKLYTDFTLIPPHIMNPNELQRMLNLEPGVVVKKPADYAREPKDKPEIIITDKHEED